MKIEFQPLARPRSKGDFVQLRQEVNPVMKALRDNGIELSDGLFDKLKGIAEVNETWIGPKEKGKPLFHKLLGE